MPGRIVTEPSDVGYKDHTSGQDHHDDTQPALGRNAAGASINAKSLLPSGEISPFKLGRKIPTTRPRRRSSLVYSESVNDLDDEAEELVSHDTRVTPEPLLESFKPVLPLCTRCRENAILKSPFTPGYSGPPSPNPHAGSPPARHRRKSSISSPFAGSYEESLLSGRMAANSSAPVRFAGKLGALGTTKPNKDPKHESTKQSAGHSKRHLAKQLVLDLDAVFYDWGGDSGAGSPYAGSINLDSYYELRQKDGSKKFPGYRIPRHGQIQLIISNPQKTAVQFFLVPYDLSQMEANQKTVLRQKTYEGRSRLVQAIQLPVARPANSSKYYLHGTIRVVFHNRLEDSLLTSMGRLVNTRVETVFGGFSTLEPQCSHCGEPTTK